MKNKKLALYICIALACLVSGFLTLFQHSKVPACINADEAAFAYNAYSILKTGRDEYGEFMPLRLKSFGDYKMPLYSYISVPFIAVMGLNEQSARAANVFIAFLFPLAVYLLAKELFGTNKASVAAAFISATSLGLHIIARQAHEAYLSAFLATLATYFFMRLLKQTTFKRAIPFLIVLFFSLISYQSSRLFAFFYLGIFALYVLFKKADKKVFLVTLIMTGLFFLPDIIHTPARVGNLLFYKNPGLGMKTHELRTEGGNIVLYNKVTVAARDLISNHLEYFSPQFLTSRGDTNYRFGFPDMSPVTAVEYLVAIGGVYYLFKNKAKYRYFIAGLLFTAPLAGSLSWAGASISRTLFLLVLVALMAGYGIEQLLAMRTGKLGKLILPALLGAQLFLLIFGWDIYINHYPKRAIVVRAAQCGYKELTTYIDGKYDSVDKFYISTQHGQPYIFQLFYSQMDPSKYQKKASLSAPDEYGFGQMLGYDKFHYTFPSEPPANSVVIGYPEDFNDSPAYGNHYDYLKKVQIGNEKIFWMLDTRDIKLP